MRDTSPNKSERLRSTNKVYGKPLNIPCIGCKKSEVKSKVERKRESLASNSSYRKNRGKRSERIRSPGSLTKKFNSVVEQ